MGEIEKILVDKLPFYSKLIDEQKLQLLNASDIKTIKKGEAVVRTNLYVEDIVVVIEGTLQSFMNAPTLNKEIVLFNLLEYDICILSNSKNYSDLGCKHTELKAKTDAKILFIKGDIFKNVCDSNIEAQKFLLALTQNKLTSVLQKIYEIVFFSTEKRVARYLLYNADLTNNLILNIRHDEIANDLGTVREVVSKIIKKFENNNILKQLRRGYIEIIDIEKLKE